MGVIDERSFVNLRPDMWVTIAAIEMPQPPVNAASHMDVTLRVMGDKSPKATHKHAVQKQVKAGEEQSHQRQASSEDQEIKTRYTQSVQP